MNTSPALGDARVKLSSSVTIIKRASIVTNTQGVILMISSTGDFLNKNLMNSISCGSPDISVIFTTLSLWNVQSEAPSFSQKSKSGDSTDVKEDPYVGSNLYY